MLDQKTERYFNSLYRARRLAGQSQGVQIAGYTKAKARFERYQTEIKQVINNGPQLERFLADVVFKPHPEHGIGRGQCEVCQRVARIRDGLCPQCRAVLKRAQHDPVFRGRIRRKIEALEKSEETGQ